MKRRADSIADAIIREARVVTLPDGTSGRLIGDYPEGECRRLVLNVTEPEAAGLPWRFVLLAPDALVEIHPKDAA